MLVRALNFVYIHCRYPVLVVERITNTIHTK